MLKPELQNDFSFYRRSLGSRALQSSKHAQPVSSDMANVLSMWLAQNLPMTSSIRRDGNVLSFSLLSNICCGMLGRGAVGPSPDSLSRILHTMVASVVLYDRLSREGSFAQQSPVKVRVVCM